MKVEIQRIESSQPIVYEDVVNAYTKGKLYCVMFVSQKTGERMTHKYPIRTIFRVVEDYPEIKR